MAWLIFRVEPAENDTLPERLMKPIVEQIAVRVPLDFEMAWHTRKQSRGQTSAARIIELLAEHGYETMDDWSTAHAPVTAWPLTAFTYVSPNREGMGRTCSTLKRIPVRRKQ